MNNYLGFILIPIIINFSFSQDPCILGDVYISEAANAGNPEDYIEVYNGGSFVCTLVGFQLDDSQDLEDLTFSNVILAPGSYWIGYRDEDDSFNSGLSNNGDIVVFADAIGNILTVTLEESIEVDGVELSQSFESDGTSCYTLPTPGESNAECFEFILGCTDPDANNYNEDANLNDGSCEYPTTSCILGDIYVSEAANAGNPEDYIEVYNGGSFVCTLAGFQLDDSEDLEDLTFSNVILAPGGYWLGYRYEDNSFNSGLSNSGDIVVFADANDNMLTVTLEESIEVDGIELSQSFESDGTGCYTLPTPGESNVECFDENLSNAKGNSPIFFDLSGAYPNPFNPTTSITYMISEYVSVSIDACNVNGQIVESIYKGFKTPGKYSINWNANHLSSGIYLITMNTGSFVETQKVTLVK